MYKKKKVYLKVIISISLVFVILNVLSQFIFGSNIVDLGCDYYQRNIARRPHITGQIECNINGKLFLLDDSQCELIYKDGKNNTDKLKLEKGQFKRRDGKYGDNIFELKLSPDFCVANINKSLLNGISIEFGYRTPNNWHKEDINFKIHISDLNKNTDMANVKLKQTVTGDDSGNKNEHYILKYNVESHERLKIFLSFI